MKKTLVFATVAVLSASSLLPAEAAADPAENFLASGLHKG